jgi:hypothetical protein
VAFIDAFDWVVEPNVLGMGTYALGQMMTTKPYISGAAYIDRMSDYCGTCAFDPKSTAGGLDLRTPLPHGGLDVAPRQKDGAGTAEELVVAGVTTIGGEAGNGLPLAAVPQWHDGRWTLTFRRALAPRERSEMAFVPGEPVLFALAVWDGRRDASPASKAISTWHVLELQR